MLPGLELITGGLLYLAAGSIQCTVPKAPHVSVTPITKDIEYDFSHSRDDLGRVRSNTTSPFKGDVDTTTGGLRYDTPKTELQVQIGYRQYSNGLACFWYDTVDFKVKLQPRIYIAKEYKKGKCRSEIIAHEQRHVVVDRKLVNQLSQVIGKDLKVAVNKVGPLGPYNVNSVEDVKAMMVATMNDIVKAHEKQFESEMRTRQKAVDSLAEYERISEICHKEGY